MDMVNKVYQDSSSAFWSHYIETDGVHWHYEEILVAVPATTADPATPEATQLS